MELTKIPCGRTVRVVSAGLDPAMRSRLRILGIYAGARVTVLKISPLRHTFLIGTEYARVVLARAAAEEIVCA